MKLSDGFTKFWPSVFIFVFYAISFAFLTLALRKLELSTAYAIWSGAGTVAITLIGVWIFQDSIGAAKILFISMIIIGVVGLNLVGKPH